MTMQGTWIRSLGREDPLEREMATHSQYSCLGNPMDREAWQAIVHGVTKSLTWLSTQGCTLVYLLINWNKSEVHFISSLYAISTYICFIGMFYFQRAEEICLYILFIYLYAYLYFLFFYCFPFNGLEIFSIVIQSGSHVQLFNPIDHSTSGFPVLHYLQEFAQIQISLLLHLYIWH